jgi:hypothetical protein
VVASFRDRAEIRFQGAMQQKEARIATAGLQSGALEYTNRML